MTITYHRGIIQGGDEWHALRCGLITASEVKLLLTPTLKRANNDKSRAHVWELAAQRITRHVEPSYSSDDMIRGLEDEFYARQLYRERIAPVEEVGFVTNDAFGFVLGCSPDGLVGSDGMIECKSRRQKYQVQTIVEHWRDGVVPEDYTLQIQTEMLVCDRAWCDLVSYSGGLPMATMRIERDAAICAAIVDGCRAAESEIAKAMADYAVAVAERGLIETERRAREEMYA
jgi:predicted phage-related endonuclease